MALEASATSISGLVRWIVRCERTSASFFSFYLLFFTLRLSSCLILSSPVLIPQRPNPASPVVVLWQQPVSQGSRRFGGDFLRRAARWEVGWALGGGVGGGDPVAPGGSGGEGVAPATREKRRPPPPYPRICHQQAGASLRRPPVDHPHGHLGIWMADTGRLPCRRPRGQDDVLTLGSAARVTTLHSKVRKGCAGDRATTTTPVLAS